MNGKMRKAKEGMHRQNGREYVHLEFKDHNYEEAVDPDTD